MAVEYGLLERGLQCRIVDFFEAHHFEHLDIAHDLLFLKGFDRILALQNCKEVQQAIVALVVTLRQVALLLHPNDHGVDFVLILE